MTKEKKQAKKPSKPKRSPSGAGRPQRGLGRGILDSAPTTTSKNQRPVQGWGWTKEFQRLVEFRRGNPGRWPSRDSANAMEARLADWLRGNLELYWARRLRSEQIFQITNLLEGRYDTVRKGQSKSGPKTNKSKKK